MSTALDDFFGDGSADNTPECSYCGKTTGNLIISIRDAHGPTHWHHAECAPKSAQVRSTPFSPDHDRDTSTNGIE